MKAMANRDELLEMKKRMKMIEEIKEYDSSPASISIRGNGGRSFSITKDISNSDRKFIEKLFKLIEEHTEDRLEEIETEFSKL